MDSVLRRRKVNFVGKCVLLRSCSAAFMVVAALLFYGCGGDGGPLSPSLSQLVEFQNAGPVPPKVDVDRLLEARTIMGVYRIVPGDLLELQMPSILQVVTADSPVSQSMSEPYLCRVSYDGNITVPVIGQVSVVGKSLTETGTAIVEAFYPEYCVDRPTVVVRVTEYRTIKVCINGAVKNPGVYELRGDQTSLVSLIMASGGIVDDGAAIIRINRKEQSGMLAFHQDDSVTAQRERLLNTLDTEAEQQVSDTPGLEYNADENKSLILPIKGKNVPFTDVSLQEGDVAIIEPLEQPRFTVIGLVNKAGTFEYPPNVQYNLIEALACAGDLNMSADPQYATIYRQKVDGTIVDTRFKIIDDSRLTSALSVLVKPGDIIAVEQTPKTRTNLFLNNVFRINTGLYTTVRIIE